MNSRYWIQTLGLEKHPEGGFFREVYRSDETVIQSALPDRFGSERCFSTSIYYLLDREDVSSFHRIQQDEIWHFYDGSPLLIYIVAKRRMTVFQLGRDPHKGQLPMLMIPKGSIFAAEVKNKHSFGLIGCTVSPGFEFEDFELLSRATLVRKFPERVDLINRLSKAK
jgi:uncharacterized protein